MEINFKELQQQFIDTIAYSQEFDRLIYSQETLDYIFEQWFNNKEFFLSKTNNQMIYDCGPIDGITLYPNAENDFDDFIVQTKELMKLYNVEYYDKEIIIDFLQSHKKDFYMNKISEYGLYRYRRYNIKEGMKLTRAISNVVEYEVRTVPTEKRNSLIREIQDLMSRYLQKTSMTGHLYLSVHPIDFLTLSENNNNWRSCHSLNGDYRAGNLGYMLDASTIVCYIANPEYEELSYLPFKWNNKKWRMLAHINEAHTGFYLNRQYPTNYPVLYDEVVKHLSHIINLDLKTYTEIGIKVVVKQNDEPDPYNFVYGKDNYIMPIEAFLNKDYPKILLLNSRLNYNDIVYSPHYVPVVAMYEPYIDIDRDLYADIGVDKIPCICCGGKINRGISSSDTFLCTIHTDEYYNNNDEEEDY